MSRKEDVATATARFCLMINQPGMCPISGGMIATGPMRCGLLNKTRCGADGRVAVGLVACHTQVLVRRFTQGPQRLRQIYWDALLHDFGKIGIPDAILLKQGPLTEQEWVVMRTHPEIGHHILASVPFMDEAAEIVLCHEERFDGTGYPRGLSVGRGHSTRGAA